MYSDLKEICSADNFIGTVFIWQMLSRCFSNLQRYVPAFSGIMGIAKYISIKGQDGFTREFTTKTKNVT